MTSLGKPFGLGAAATLLGAAVAQRYFPGHEAMAACAFVVFGLGPFTHELLDFNRNAIWSGTLEAAAANRKLASEFIGIFLGVFAGALLCGSLLEHPAPPSFDTLYKNEFGALVLHNLQILLVGTVLTLAYRANGMVLILSWNALAWAHAGILYVAEAYRVSGLSSALLLSIGLLPHLLLEALAFVLSGMAGVFLSKAIMKYRFSSPEFERVARACGVLGVLAIGTLILGAGAEIVLGQRVFHAVFDPVIGMQSSLN